VISQVDTKALDPLRRQRGQGMVEYALILVLVSIVVIVILLTMGNQIVNVFSNVVAALG
jgi:pilus assembly protein Flp/PilA